MKITVKTLQQQTFTVEASGTDTVQVLKQKIEDEKGKEAFPATCQKLIYAGKILDNEKLISDYNIEEKNFVVAMITKAKAPPVQKPATSEPAPESQTQAEPAAQPTPTPAPATSEGDASVTTEAEAMSTETTPSAPTDAAGSTPQAATDTASSFMSGASLEENVQSLMAMGFGREKVLGALRASFYNRDRAVEYLVTGASLPTDEDEPSATEPVSAPVSVPASGGGANPLEYLRSQPQFQTICEVLRGNPTLLPGLLGELRESNPELLDQINQNQEAFIQLINGSQPATPAGGAAPTVPATGGGTAPPGADAPPGTQYIQVTTEDKEAIDRIKALGNFNESDVLQMYFACDKNETAAANILFENELNNQQL